MNKLQKTRDQMWTYIRKRKEFTISDICIVLRIPRARVYSYVRALKLAGIVVCKNPQESNNNPRLYFLAKDYGVNRPDISVKGVPKEGSSMQKCWASMKVLQSFRAADLSLVTGLTKDTVLRILNAYEKAGYVYRPKKCKGFAGHSTYKFVKSKDTGPIAPPIVSEGNGQ